MTDTFAHCLVSLILTYTEEKNQEHSEEGAREEKKQGEKRKVSNARLLSFFIVLLTK